ncbi:MAG: divalent metal cation transporter [Bacteroidetes bacterium]|nr:MAG: divalent metal cation transporter [Bacteroidota bacterium]
MKQASSALLGAAFLMATSAIGPGFLTQTAVFTEELLASFGFVILVSVLLDLGAQLNIWRILTVRNQRAQELADSVAPGLGYFLGGLVAFGGLAFNIGNIGGCGLGLNALTGMDIPTAALLSGLLAVLLFWLKDAGRVMDAVVKVLGVLLLGLTVYVAFAAQPPVGEALYRTVWPEQLDALAIITLVGGTVGGYISFAGAHRLLDAGVKGPESIPKVQRSATTGILLTAVMRFVLFLAAFGVLAGGASLDPGNPPASVFRLAGGEIGYRLFGLAMWCAAITSVIGSAYTSVSFIRTWHPRLNSHHRWLITGFILVSTVILLWLGKPVQLLILAGAVNGLILPVALAVVLIAAGRHKVTAGYLHPRILTIAGWLVVLAMSWMGVLGCMKLL